MGDAPAPMELKLERIRQGLKQSDVAKKAKVSQQVVSQVEAGECKRLDQVTAVARALGLVK